MTECVYIPHLEIQLKRHSFHSQHSFSLLIMNIPRLLRIAIIALCEGEENFLIWYSSIRI